MLKTIRAGVVALALGGFALAGAIPVEAATYSPAPGVHITVNGPYARHHHPRFYPRYYHPRRHRERVCWHTWRHHHRVLVCTWRWHWR
jgi:hypothetical protein